MYWFGTLGKESLFCFVIKQTTVYLTGPVTLRETDKLIELFPKDKQNSPAHCLVTFSSRFFLFIVFDHKMLSALVYIARKV